MKVKNKVVRLVTGLLVAVALSSGANLATASVVSCCAACGECLNNCQDCNICGSCCVIGSGCE